MKPQASLTRDQLDAIPAPFRKLLTGAQLGDPQAIAYLLNLALVRSGPLKITVEDLVLTPGEGALTIGIHLGPPPSLHIFFLSGDPDRATDEVARRHPKLPLFPVDPSLADKDPKQ